MELNIQRDSTSNLGTTGKMSVDGVFAAYTLEPYLGDGGIGCAIPVGRYPVIMDWSDHFQTRLAHVQNVPDRTAVEIHDGNTVKDTTGCILVGMERINPGTIAESDRARMMLQSRIASALAHAAPVWLTVENPPVSA